MERRKTKFHGRNKILQKTSAQSEAKLRSAKKSHHNKKDSEEMDSLMFLKDSREKKYNDELDEKIKLLKSELKMLLGDSKSDNYNSGSEFENDLLSQELLIDKWDWEKPLTKKSKIEPPLGKNSLKADQLKCSPLKVSQLLDKTTDEMNVKTLDERKLPKCNDLILNSKSQEASTPKKCSMAETSYKSKIINSSALSQDKVEQLLYQSLYLQNFDIYLSSSDENDPDQIKSTKALKLQKKKTKKPCKPSKEKSYQSKINRFWKSPQRRKTRKRTVANFSSKYNMDLDYSASDNSRVLKEKKIDYVDLDVTDYDWDEPFDIGENSGLSLDVEILDSPDKKSTVIEEKLKNNNFRPVTCDLNVTSDKPQGGLPLKTGWECPICFEQSKGQEVMATQCGHIFCRKCLESYMSKFSQNCPTCRVDLTNKPPITLFNF